MKFGKPCNVTGWIKFKNFPKDMWGGFAVRKEKLQELSFKIMSSKLNDKIFQKNLKSSIFNLFLNRYGLCFYKFLSFYEKSGKSLYISDEVVHSKTARKRDDRTDRKRSFHRTTTLHVTPHHKPPHFTELPLHVPL